MGSLKDRFGNAGPETDQNLDRQGSPSGSLRDRYSRIPGTPPDDLAYEQDYPTRRAILKNARTTLEMGGMIGGGLLAAPLGPWGIIGGEALGYAGLKKAADVMDYLFYPKSIDRQPPPPPDLKTSLIKTLGDVKEGAMISMLGPVAGKLIPLSRISSGLRGSFGREVKSPEIKTNLEAFRAQGLDPLPSEVMAKETSRTAAGVEGAFAYSPFTANIMYKRALERLDDLNMRRNFLIRQGAPLDEIDQVGRAIKNEAEDLISKKYKAKGEFLQKKVDKFVNELSKERTNFNAGEAFQKTLKDTQKSMAKETSALYDDFAVSLGSAGEVKIPISQHITSVADELYAQELKQKDALRNMRLMRLLKPYTTKGLQQGASARIPNVTQFDKETQDLMINKIRQESGQDFMTMKSTRTRINDIIAERNKRGYGLNDTYNKQLMDFEAALEKDQLAYADSIGRGAEFRQIVAKRRDYHELFNEDTLKLMAESPQKLAQQIVGRNDIATYKILKNKIGEPAVAPIKEAFFDDMLKASMGKDGMLDGAKLAKLYAKIEPELLTEMLPQAQQDTIKLLIKRANAVKLNLRNSDVLDFLKDLTLTSNQNIVNKILEANNPERAKMAVKLFSDEGRKKINQHAIAQTLAISKEGNILPVTSAGNFTKYRLALKELLPEESFKGLEEFIRVGQNAKRVEQLALNASQTGQLLIYRDVFRRLMVNPITSIATLGAAGGIGGIGAAGAEALGIAINVILAKVYLSKTALNFFTTSLKLSPESPAALSLFTKAIAIAYQDAQDEKTKSAPRAEGKEAIEGR